MTASTKTLSAVMPPGNRALRKASQRAWTEEEYLALSSNQLVEFCDGQLEVLPMPLPFHHFIVRFLLERLRAFIQANNIEGDVLFAPVPVRLRAGKFREPDIFFFRPERMPDSRQPPDGADLVMEVVSEGQEQRDRDLVTKRKEYAEAGIAEYWIVDPKPQQITVLTLSRKTYKQHGLFGLGQTASSRLLRGFSVSVDEVFAAGER